MCIEVFGGVIQIFGSIIELSENCSNEPIETCSCSYVDVDTAAHYLT